MDFKEIEQTVNEKDLSKKLLKNYKDGKKINLSLPEKKKIQKDIEDNSFRLKDLPTLNYIVLGLLYSRNK